jgi:hypothetical protein
MQSSPGITPILREASSRDVHGHGQRTADRVYQCLTVAAMVWALASLWVF